MPQNNQFPAEDVANVPMDYENHAGITKKILNGVDYYVGEAYFVIDSEYYLFPKNVYACFG